MPEIKIPGPFLIIVDDLGWWNGRDGSKENQPFRTGMARRHVPEDYLALAALGRAFDMRIPAGFVLCEWDRTNLLRQLPSATWMGGGWQTPYTSPSNREKAAEIIKDAASYIEFALHGVGHEFWIDSKMDRSEFHTSSGRMRKEDDVKKHLDYFFRLMVQNHLESKVRVFIPPALNHSFGDGEHGFQKIIGSLGLQFVTLRFDRARCHMPPQYQNVGWECGVAVIDRGKTPVPWNRVAPVPDFNPAQFILPLHWANILHDNPERNMNVVNAWVQKINQELAVNELMPARDIAQYLTQYLNMTRSKIRNLGNEIVVDMDWVHEVPKSVLSDSVFFSVTASSQLDMDVAGTEQVPPSFHREAGFVKLRLPRSGKVVFRFSQNT